MTKLYLNNQKYLNLYKNRSKNSEIVTQALYGEGFSILSKKKNWLKIKLKDDGYKGFIINKSYPKYQKPTHKVSVLKANLFNKIRNKKIIGNLTFNSKIRESTRKNGFVKFNNKWIEEKNIKPIKFKNKDYFKNIMIFKGIKYKWGGKTFKGLDCSALVQLFLNFNNIFFPRDAKDQVKYLKKKINLNKIKKNDLIYWKGHVAVILTRKKLIHAYGPMKKTVVMDVLPTIKRIKKTAKLEIISIKRL